MNEGYEITVGKCIEVLQQITHWIQLKSVIDNPNQADILEMAELAARLKYAAEVIK